MAITNNLNFNRKQLNAFGRLFRASREQLGMTQLQVATAAFGYEISHCKVSRVERKVMPKVDAFAISRIADVLGVPQGMLKAIDPKFSKRLAVAKLANKKGFWDYPGDKTTQQPAPAALQ